MKKILLLFFSIAILNTAYAQDLFVSSNSYIYAEDAVVFVNDDVQLKAGGNFYLRDGAQLLQNTNTKNWDEGELSVYQIPTVNYYGYHYWCSPVGYSIGDATQGDRNFDYRDMRQPNSTTTNEINSTAYGVSPFWEGDPNAISVDWLWSAVNMNNYNDWVYVGDNTNILPPGQGFSMKGRVGTPTGTTKEEIIDFRGRPNTGTFTIDCTWTASDVDNQEWLSSGSPGGGNNGHYVETLIGNPYPSTMDLKLLFYTPTPSSNLNLGAARNTGLNGKVYFWQEGNTSTHVLSAYEGGYATWVPGTSLKTDNGTFTRAVFKKYDSYGNINNPDSGSQGANYTGPTNRRYAAIGQGFFVRSVLDGGGPVTISNDMRVYFSKASNPDIFERVDNKNNDALISAAPGSNENTQITARTNESAQEIVAMSHNGLDYKYILNNPTTIPEISIISDVNDTFYRTSVIAFRDGVDANTLTKYVDAAPVDYFKSDTYILAGNEKALIKSLEYAEDVRLGFGIQAGKENNNVFNITTGNLKNVPSDVNIYLYDKQTGIYTDIKNGEFSITLDKGVYNDRFEITFSQQAPLDVEENYATQLQLFQNNTSSEVTILNPNSLNIKSFQLYDVTGKLILSKQKFEENTKYTFDTRSLSTGVYIANIKVGESDVLITKKIVINNN